MMNQRGLTLTEVLGSTMILAIAVLSVTLLLQQSTLFSKDNQEIDQAVIITRTLMEEIQHQLAVQDNITVFNQPVALSLLKENLPSVSGTSYKYPVDLYYPNSADRQFRFTIESLKIEPENDTYLVKDKEFNVSKYFLHLKITCTSLKTGKTFELESYVEYN